MYTKYFGFREAPFSATPDPRFFYNNSFYQEALAGLLYGIQARKGIIVVSGEVGVGKTTLLRKLMRNLEPTVRTIFVSNTLFSFGELFQLILHDLGLNHEGKNRLLSLRELNGYLLQQLKEGRTVSLLIDEAHNLSNDSLEALRLLSNLETEREKLLQMVLVGQPELESKLDHPSLRQLKQRVSIHARLKGLDDREIGRFIDHRLRAAGYEGDNLFARDAVRKVASYSKGIPRLINNICDNALLIAYAASAKKVSADTIDEVARDLHLGSVGPTVQNAGIKDTQEAQVRSPKTEAATAKVEAVTPRAEPAVSKVIRSREEAFRIVKGKPPAEFEAPPSNKKSATVEAKSVDETVRAWTDKILQGLDELGSSSLARFAVGVFLAILLLAGVASATLQNRDRMQSLSHHTEKLLSLLGARFGILKNNIHDLLAALSSSENKPEKIEASLAGEPFAARIKEVFVEEKVKTRDGAETATPEEGTQPPSRPAVQERPSPETKLSTSSPISSPPLNWKESPVTVKQGSTIRQVAADFYGPNNLLLGMSLIRDFNPQIKDLHWISAGERLWIPPPSRETLARRHEDGSYRLIVASFSSIMQAVEAAQVIRNRGYPVVIALQRLSDDLLLHRVEIGGLENLEAVDRAWAVAVANRWLPSSAKLQGRTKKDSGEEKVTWRYRE